MKRVHIVNYPRIAAFAILTGIVLHLGSQSSAAADNPQPQTTADPTIPVDELELMLRPLTSEELVVEANGWMKLVQDKVTEISSYEIKVKRKSREIEATKKAAEEAEQAAKEAEAAAVEAESNGTPGPVAAPDVAEIAEKTREAERKAEEKDAVVHDIVKLREQRQKLIDRFRTVLDELKAKGGEVKAYETYVTAVAGLAVDVDVSDASVLWTTGKGWLISKEGGAALGQEHRILPDHTSGILDTVPNRGQRAQPCVDNGQGDQRSA